jgi:conjugative relaxase-like TrwC/TraI family protein
MLSIGKLAAGARAGAYYLEQVASGREDYYAGGGEAPGEWGGGGAKLLGLAGEVSEEGLRWLLESRHPVTGEALRRPVADGAVAGFDLTFRAPKSVSVLFGVADDDHVVQEIRQAHRAAVSEGMRYLQGHACAARRGKGGLVAVSGRGFVAAAFEHRASRAGDPLLHTHVVVANMTLGPDGRWTALDGRLLYRHAKAAGYVYQAALRAEMRERLGLAFDPAEHGVADVVGMPRGVIEHFSQRRTEILRLMHRRGEHSARAAQVATLESRRAKEYLVPEYRLREEWRARAAEHGFGRRMVAVVLSGVLSRRDPVEDLEQTARSLEGPGGLTRDRATFTRSDVVQAFAEAAQTGARLQTIEARADAFLERDAVVELEGGAGEPRYTTQELIDTERELLGGAARRRGEAAGLASESALDAALTARPILSEEQRALVVALTSSGDGVQVVRAAAGTGKTLALDAAQEAWARSGVSVLGCALAARAAGELRDQAGIDATTIARLRHAIAGGLELEPGSVLVVDEAGMVGTRDLAVLAVAAARAQAKLVLVGDDRQLPEIQAGGAFRALAESLGGVELHEVRRQSAAWDRAALVELRGGDVVRFAEMYARHGRLVAAPTADDARSALVEDWWSAQDLGGRTLMIAHRRADVADLNDRARARLRAEGRLGPDVSEQRAFAIGDRVVTTRNDARSGAINGQAGILVAVNSESWRVRLDQGGMIELSRPYVEGGHLAHGYAITAHRAQGATVDRTFVLGSDELYREWGYTALSRHTEEARFYVTASPQFLNAPTPPIRNAADAVARQLEESRAQETAVRFRLAYDPTPARLSTQRGRGLER